MVPENLILAQTGVSSGELAEAWAANNGESATNLSRFGPTTAELEAVARTSTSDGRHKRSG